jgi:erythromycin esterase
MTPTGMHLADRLGSGYRVIGMTTGTGQTLNTDADFYAGKLFTTLEPPRPDSLDGLMAASHDSPFAADLRRLSPTDTATVSAITQQRYGAFYAEIDPLKAYDVIVHLPRGTAAQADQDALAHSPGEVQETFAHGGLLVPPSDLAG